VCGVKIVCDNVGGKRRSAQLEIAANVTCCHVIRVAMETFGMTSVTDDPSDYSLIQIDRNTKGSPSCSRYVIMQLYNGVDTVFDSSENSLKNVLHCNHYWSITLQASIIESLQFCYLMLWPWPWLSWPRSWPWPWDFRPCWHSS